MKTKVIEATSTVGNWGKFMVCRFTDEWKIRSRISQLEPGKAMPLHEAETYLTRMPLPRPC